MLSDRTSNALIGVSKATLHQGVRVKHLFRVMTRCSDLWMAAYAKIYSNRGALSLGVTENTLDGMSEKRISEIMNSLKDETYTPKPAKRVLIPKANGKHRPLGVPTGDDKLVQEVVRILLEQVYEPVFSPYSHGFRPKRSCHTALSQIKDLWSGVKWVVDMDISSFYDSIDHDILINLLEKKIDDRKFIRVIKLLLKAGCLENWTFKPSYSGTPQGGICSPILANIFLHELDEFMKERVGAFTKGQKRKRDPECRHWEKEIEKRRAKINRLKLKDGSSRDIQQILGEIKEIDTKRKQRPAYDMYDDDFKRLRYVRYADDFVIGLMGSKQDAENIWRDVEEFLKEKLKLQIAKEKSGIHHIKKGFGYLGYHLTIGVDRPRILKTKVLSHGKIFYRRSRTAQQSIRLHLPKERVWTFCHSNGYLKERKPQPKFYLTRLSDYEIISQYNAEMRGFANYYCLASKHNLYLLEWAGTSSMYMTLAQKYKVSSQQMRRKLKRGDEHMLQYNFNGKEKNLMVFKIKHRQAASSEAVDRQPSTHLFRSSTELVQRMQAKECEYCGKTDGNFEVHHVRKLKDIEAKTKKKPWEVLMCARKRKTLVLCFECHRQLHAGKLEGWKKKSITVTESRVQ